MKALFLFYMVWFAFYIIIVIYFPLSFYLAFLTQEQIKAIVTYVDFLSISTIFFPALNIIIQYLFIAD